MKYIRAYLFNIFRLAISDFKSKYAGSALGVLWATAEPLVTVAVYRFVYTVAFGGADICGVPYYLWLSVGLASWLFISDGLKGICLSFRDYSFLVKKMRFNKAILPNVRCVSCLFAHILFLIIVVITAVFNRISPSGILILFLMVIICTAYVLSLGKILALICGYCKDVYNVLCVVLNVGFWVTPVFWNAESADASIKKIIELNPAALIAEGYRDALFFGSALEASKLIYLLCVTAVIYLTAKILEKAMISNIADRL